jgi:hypothetical protein
VTTLHMSVTKLRSNETDALLTKRLSFQNADIRFYRRAIAQNLHILRAAQE